VKIDKKSLRKAINQFDGMNIEEKKLLVDEIFKEQPNLLASVLVQSRLGNSMSDIDVLLKILIVVHLALKKSKVNIETISEELQEMELNRLVASIKFTEDLNDSLTKQSVSQYVAGHKEKLALAFAFNELVKSGIATAQAETTKYLVLAGLNIINCVSAAKIT